MIYKVKLEFTVDMLGTVPLNKQIYEDYIASKDGAPATAVAEADTVVEADEKGKTGFHRDVEGRPFIYDYVLKGFMKDACGMLARADGTQSSKLKAYKKVIDGLVFVFPRMLPLHLSGDMGELQRPLRAQTAQGERIALAFSDTVPEGSWIEFEIEVLADKVATEELIREWFSYGKYRGLGQWRNASWGRFNAQIEPK